MLASRGVLAGFVVVGLWLGGGMFAQAQDGMCPTGSFGGMINGSMMGGVGPGMQPLPAFSGTVKTSFEQKLLDGNQIHRVTHAKEARDSAGRTMRENFSGCSMGADGQMHEIRGFYVYDPVTRTSSSWQVGSDNQPKVVNVFHQPEIKPRAPTQRLTPEQLAQRQKAIEAARARSQELQKLTRTEHLGIRDFNGIGAEGTRTMRTIPAGAEGNDQPLEVMQEMWRSKEMGLTVMEIDDDPRRGRTTTEYEELNRGEPDPSLFTPPTGYTVNDQYPGGTPGVVATASN